MAQSERRRHRGHPEHVGAALGKLTKSLGIEKAVDEYALMAEWRGIVGEKIAAVSKPLRIDNGVMFVSVATAPWRAELSMQRHLIVKKLNQAAGREIVKEIRFR